MTRPVRLPEVWARFARATSDVYSPDEVAGLPAPVRRYFDASIAPGTPLVCAARITMRGAIRIGRWTMFRGTEVLAPHEGFLWAARAGGVITGSDRYLDGEGSMAWRALGLVPVMAASGPDVTRSAAGRCAGEAVWVPTTLLPRFGVTWTAIDEAHITASFGLEDLYELRLTLDDAGRPTSVTFDRWGDPDETGTYGWHPFGGDFTEHRTFGGLSVPSRGVLGWHHGTDRWPDGQFFRVELDSLTTS